MSERSGRRTEIGLAFASFVVIGLGGGAQGVLLPAQIDHYGLDKSVIGLVFFAFSAGYLCAGATSGWLMRRLGARGELVLGAATFSVATLACGLRPPYAVLLALTVAFGFGTGTLESALNTYLAALPGRVVLLNLLHAFYGVGALAGPVLAATMFSTGLSWGAVYLVFAGAAAALTVGFLLRYPPRLPAGPPTDPDGAPAAVRTPIFGAALRHPAVLLSAVFLAIYVGVEISIGNWTYSFLVEERGQGALLAGWVVSGYWLGFTVGRFVLSALAERLGVTPTALAWGCLTFTCVAAVGVWLLPGVVTASVGLVLLGIALAPLYPLTVAVLPRMVPDRLVPTAIGILVGVSVLGGAFFPWVAGALAERVGLGSLMPYALVLTLVLLANWWRLSRRLAAAPQPV
jgi:fucose permease